MPSQDEILTQMNARSYAVRDALSYLASIVAGVGGAPERFFQEMAQALQDRLDELPQGSSDLKERVRAEVDWIVGAAQSFHGLRNQ
jgi:hypothetical protein